MSKSKCAKCDSTSFEIKEAVPTLSKFKLQFVQCSKCGSVVGVMDYSNIGYMLTELDKKIESDSRREFNLLNNNLDIINSNINNIASHIQNFYKEIENLKRDNKKATQ